MSDTITFNPIGYVSSPFIQNTPADELRAQPSRIIISDEFMAGLLGFEPGMDVLVLFYLSHIDYEQVKLQLHPHHNPENPLRGVFATRTQYRPNPIGATVARVEEIEGNILHMTALDALDGTPILDLKPYTPHFDAEAKHPGADVRRVASLQEARHLIDVIDTEIIQLLGKRAKYVHQVVQFKNNAEEVRAQARYDEVMRRRREMAESAGLNPDVIEQMYKLLVENFIKEEMEILRQRQVGSTE